MTNQYESITFIIHETGILICNLIFMAGKVLIHQFFFFQDSFCVLVDKCVLVRMLYLLQAILVFFLFQNMWVYDFTQSKGKLVSLICVYGTSVM